MKYFTIDNENNITAHVNRQAARDTGAGVFSGTCCRLDRRADIGARLLDVE